jgi:hypothetical protein
MSKHVSFAFGRFQPPTIGHSALINKVAETSKGGDYYIFTSQSQDVEKNPLDYGTKVSFLRLLFPQQAGHIVQDPKIKTVLDAADFLESKGFTDATFVCGGDRINEFKRLLEKWNQIHHASGKGFRTLNIVSCGDREDGAEGLSGVSASLARQYAVKNDFEAFRKIIPKDPKLAQQIFMAIRKAMNLSEIKRHIRNILNEMLDSDATDPNDQRNIANSERRITKDKYQAAKLKSDVSKKELKSAKERLNTQKSVISKNPDDIKAAQDAVKTAEEKVKTARNMEDATRRESGI